MQNNTVKIIDIKYAIKNIYQPYQLLFKQYLLTGIIELMVILAYIGSFKMSSFFWGEVGFAQYSLLRRTLSVISPIMILGLDIEMPRRIAYASKNNEYDSLKAYFNSGIIIIFSTWIIISSVLLINKKFFGHLIFGDTLHQDLIFPLVIILFGLGLYAICYAFYRGMLQINYANILYFFTSGIAIMIAFVLFRNSILSALIAAGAITISIGLYTSIKILRRHNSIPYISLNHFKKLIQFGSMRMPGPLAFAALLALPGILTTHNGGIVEAGYVAFGISALGTVGTIMSPINMVLLPTACEMIASKEYNKLKIHIFILIGLAICLAIIYIGFIFLFTEQIVKFMIGTVSDQAIFTLRICSIPALPFLFYLSVRSLIDATHEKAINSRNIIITFIFFCVSCGIIYTIGKQLYLLHIFAGAMFLLSLLSVKEVVKIFKNQKAPSMVL